MYSKKGCSDKRYKLCTCLAISFAILFFLFISANAVYAEGSEKSGSGAADIGSLRTVSVGETVEYQLKEGATDTETFRFSPSETDAYIIYAPRVSSYIDMDPRTEVYDPETGGYEKLSTYMTGMLEGLEAGSVGIFVGEAGKDYRISFIPHGDTFPMSGTATFTVYRPAAELSPGQKTVLPDELSGIVFAADHTGTYRIAVNDRFTRAINTAVISGNKISWKSGKNEEKYYYKENYKCKKIYESSHILLKAKEGKKYLILFACGGEVALYNEPFSSSDSISSISYTPTKEQTILKRSQGWSRINGKNIYEYDVPLFNDGDVITVTGSDGTDVEYKYYTEDKVFLNNELNAALIPNVSAPEKWSESAVNNCTIEYNGKTCMMPVKLVSSDLKSISYKPKSKISIYERSHGEWRGKGKKRYFKYYLDVAEGWNKGDRLTLTYNDGTVKKYVFDGKKYVNTKDKSKLEYEARVYDNQSKKHWKVGKNKYTISYLDKKCTSIATIKKNPYKSVKLVHKKKYKVYYKKDRILVDPKDLGLTGKKFNVYSFFPHKGDKLVLTRKDGKKEYYRFKIKKNNGLYGNYYFESKGGRRIWWTDLTCDYIYGGQVEKRWKTGKNYYYFSYLGKDFKVPVYVVK